MTQFETVIYRSLDLQFPQNHQEVAHTIKYNKIIKYYSLSECRKMKDGVMLLDQQQLVSPNHQAIPD